MKISKKHIIFVLSVILTLYTYSQHSDTKTTLGVSDLSVISPTKSLPAVISGSYVVTRVVDGDTIKVIKDGVSATIRLIGVDTPEVVDPRKTVQCFGKEASANTHSLLDGKTVTVTTDPTQGLTDKYNRLLRYVFLEDGTLINKAIIESGYGYEYTYNTPYIYQKEFKDAQLRAQNEKRGLWAESTCNGKH